MGSNEKFFLHHWFYFLSCIAYFCYGKAVAVNTYLFLSVSIY